MSEPANERTEKLLTIFQKTGMTEDYMENKGQLTGKHVTKSWVDYVKIELYLMSLFHKEALGL